MGSTHVLSEYSMKRKEANAQNRHLTLKIRTTAGTEVSRVSTLFSRRIITRRSPMDTLSRFLTNANLVLHMIAIGVCPRTGNSTSYSNGGSTSRLPSDY